MALVSGGDVPPCRPSGVALRGGVCAACSETVAFGDRALRLLCPVGGHVPPLCCVVDRVEWAPVGNPLRSPAKACGVRTFGVG